jgi:hypothetical protein
MGVQNRYVVSTTVKGVTYELDALFHYWHYPATRLDPEDSGCEIVEVFSMNPSTEDEDVLGWLTDEALNKFQEKEHDSGCDERGED